ncbi:hypothetical protein PV327_003391 [Microctonus hyperodae]|uniref:F5/8 type C domain-containing protein n=1 Tax=Microctonus hyperodae TaxID=165561 RepID=A0AA39L0Z4_MICHY|nr:hypothetical protein PV327_003391 [Microctonus hyperodae]
MNHLRQSFLFYIILLYHSNGDAIDISQCISPLGMEAGIIPDADITASSSFDSGNVGPQHGRLKQERNGGAWCPKQQVTTEPYEWLEIDLRTVHVITGTGTQGRFGNGQGVEYAEAYILEYWRPKLGKWVRYRDLRGEEVIQGNTNTYLESKHELDPAIWASKIRFLPYSYHRRTVCMRVELYGCPWNDGIVSYSMPQGDKRGNWEFFDASYDGYWDGELRRGLGQITDGHTGPDDFKMGYYGYDHGQGWVGWRNDTRAGHPLDIKFEFDHVREFSAVHIFCNNQFTKDVEVFSEVNILFSIGGKWYTGDPIIYSYMEDKIFETPRNVSIKLHHRIGRFIKLRFTLAAKWLMISEITFDSAQCISPLGMESGAIPNEDITASSSFDSGNVGPHQSRLRTENHGGAWCPKAQITNEPREWLEIDLHSVHMITGTNTQGRFGNGVGVEYAEGYLLEYWRPRLGKWVRYRDIKGKEILKGNTNTYLENKHDLDPPLWASKIRFFPYSNHRRTVCMRVELYGCLWTDGIIAYSMPQGDTRGNEWEFFDSTYDGHWDGELRRGLGQLVDGRIGPDNFKMGYYDSIRSQGWVAWRNDTRANEPIEIKFEFDRVREFAAVHLYCNNQFSRDVQVFSQVDVLFSVGGKYFSGEPIVYTYMEDKIFETSRNITIKLHHRVGKFIILRLHFSSKWIMLSEIIFDSDVAHGNFTSEEQSTTDSSLPDEIFVNEKNNGVSLDGELPVLTAQHDDPTYMAVVIGILTAVILLLAVAIFFIVSRHRQRKCFASPVAVKVPSHLGSTCATVEKGAALMAYTLEEDEG